MQLGIGEARPTTVTLQLADYSFAHPKGKIEDVLIRVDKFVFPVDFIILDFEADREVPIILGRLFLAMRRTLIDVQKGELTMRVNDQEVTFNIFDALKYPDEGSEECSFVKTIDSLVQKQICREQDNFKEELAQFEDGKLLEEEKLEFIEEKQAIPRWTKRYESLELTSENFKENVPSIEKPLVLELKQLPSHLKYVYLGDNETLLMIISS